MTGRPRCGAASSPGASPNRKPPSAKPRGGRTSSKSPGRPCGSGCPVIPPPRGILPTVLKTIPRLPALAAALLRAEAGRRRLSESLPELTSLLGRLFPEGNPHEVEAFLIPALLQEDPAGPRRYLAGLPGKTDLFHRPAGVILFDALCASDPAGAWRFAEASVEASGGKDDRTVNHWTSASLREHATPAQRIGAGFPDYSDMAVLARLWVKADAPAALSTFCGEKVPASLQKLAIEMALSPAGAHIPPDDLKEWAKRHSPRMLKIVTVWLDQTEAR